MGVAGVVVEAVSVVPAAATAPVFLAHGFATYDTYTSGTTKTAQGTTWFTVVSLVTGGSAKVDKTSLAVVTAPSATDGTATTTKGTAGHAYVEFKPSTKLTPTANPTFSLTFGICAAGKATYSAATATCTTGTITYKGTTGHEMGGTAAITILGTTHSSPSTRRSRSPLQPPPHCPRQRQGASTWPSRRWWCRLARQRQGTR